MSAMGQDVWRRTLLVEESVIRDAIENLDRSGCQIVLVVDGRERLVGTVTDGDIRRGLLRGLTLESPLATVTAREPFVVPPEIATEMAMQLMQANSIRQLPVVGQDRQVIGLYRWDDFVHARQRRNVMVLMAGGRGTRLHPHTADCPKPLLPVAGKPMLQHIIERAKAQGFERFVVAVHFLGHMIEEHFGDGSALGISIEYLHESTPLGTAGAVGLLDPTPDAPFVVSNGDVLADVHYGEMVDFHSRHGAVATMAVRVHEWQHPFGVVRTQGVDIVGFEEKPISRTHINAGIYVLEPAALAALDRNAVCDMPTLFGRLQDRGLRTIVYPMHEPWLDVGRADDLTRAHELRAPDPPGGGLGRVGPMIDGKRVLAVIPARGGSKGLPGKNTRQMCGKPLIAWSIDQAIACPLVDTVMVSTDSTAVADVARNAGASVPFLRPAALATDQASTIDVLLHALDTLEAAGDHYDYLLLLEPTSPLRDVADITGAIGILDTNPAVGSVVGVAEAESTHPSFMMTVERGLLRPMLAGTNPTGLRRQDLRQHYYYLEGSVYATTVASLRVRRSFYHECTAPWVVARYKALEIDQLSDFIAAEALMQAKLEGVLSE